MGNVGWLSIVLAGWPVLSILLFGSIATVAIIRERWKYFKGIQTNSDEYLASIRSNNDRQKILSWCAKSDQPLAQITKNIYTAKPNREDKERILQRSIQALVQKMEYHVSTLGTIASVAPFVGLLGTVIGIIRAFRAISMTDSSGAALVAVGISEALVGTAGGLIVAIPALLGYNYFANRIRRFTQEWELVGAELIDLSLRNENKYQ